MNRFVKILLVILVPVLVGLSLLGWWYLRWDEVEAPELPGKLEAGTLTHDGLTRRWLAYLPSSISTRPAVVLVMHGSQGSAQAMRSMSFYSFEVQAERAGYIAVYPEGFEGHWNGCRASAAYSANQRNIDDVGFLGALVDELVKRYGADPSRIYATGYSNGGHMALRLALEAPALVRAVAPVAASLPVADNLGCEEAGEPVSILVINGTEDPVNPYEGGLVEILGDASRGTVRSSRQTVEYFAGLAGYSGAPDSRDWPDAAPEDGTRVHSDTWSAAGRPTVELITVEGGGHNLPHPVFSLPLIIGPTSHEFDAAEVIWEFFSRAD